MRQEVISADPQGRFRNAKVAMLVTCWHISWSDRIGEVANTGATEAQLRERSSLTMRSRSETPWNVVENPGGGRIGQRSVRECGGEG